MITDTAVIVFAESLFSKTEYGRKSPSVFFRPPSARRVVFHMLYSDYGCREWYAGPAAKQEYSAQELVIIFTRIEGPSKVVHSAERWRGLPIENPAYSAITLLVGCSESSVVLVGIEDWDPTLANAASFPGHLAIGTHPGTDDKRALIEYLWNWSVNSLSCEGYHHRWHLLPPLPPFPEMRRAYRRRIGGPDVRPHDRA